MAEANEMQVDAAPAVQEPAPEPQAAEKNAVATEDAPADVEPEEQPAEEVEEPASAAKPSTAKKAAAKRAAPAATPASEGAAGGRAKRERKQVKEVYTVAAPKEDTFVIQAGAGDKLRDIPNVAFKLSKITGKDELLEGLHLLLYRRKGAANTRKRDVLDFSGFAFSEEAKGKEVEARKASLGKWKLELIHRLMDVLDLQRGSGDKAAKVDRVLEFLEKPHKLSEVDLAAKETAKKEKAKAKREREVAKKEKAAAKGAKGGSPPKRKSAAAGSKEPAAKKAKKEEEQAEGSEPESGGEGASEGEEGSEEEVYVPKGTRKRGKAAAAKKMKGEEEEAEAMETEENDEAGDPAAAISAVELKADVEAALSAMPREKLGGVSAKELLQTLSEKHGFSFKSRKAEIKSLAQDFVLAKLAEGGEAAGKEDQQDGQEERPAADKPPAQAEATAADAEEPPAAEEEAGNEEQQAKPSNAAPAEGGLAPGKE